MEKDCTLTKGRPTGRPKTFDHAEAVRLVASGMTLQAAADALGVVQCSVSYALKLAERANGVRMPRAGDALRSKAPPDRVQALLAQGLHQAEVARILGVNRSTVHRAVRQLESA